MGQIGARIRDFWRWALSDLKDNFNRGLLAEFLVARALGDTRPVRISWDNYDVLTPCGIRVEVKASAYLHGWPTKRHGRLEFARLRARSWDPETDTFSLEPEIRADVFVFAIQTCKDHGEYDVLNLDQWTFRVVPARIIEEHAGKSVGMAFLDRYAPEELRWEALVGAVQRAYEQQLLRAARTIPLR